MFRISKEQFVGYISDVQKVVDFQHELHQFYRKHGASEPYDTPDTLNTVVKILDDIFSPTTRDVDYFCWELDFGRKYREGMIVINGKNIDFSTAEKLYDHLISESCLELNDE